MDDEISEEALLRLWGKSDEDDPENWHPLLFHLLDVGNVTRALWDDALPASVKARIAAALGLGEAEARRFVILLAAQHDLGKASAFQTKVDNLWKAVRETLGLSLPIWPPPTPPHGFVTTKLLPTFAEQSVGGWYAPTATASILSRITGGHHGKFPTGADLLGKDYSIAAVGDDAWNTVRIALLNRVVEQLFPKAESDTTVATTVLEKPVLRDSTIVPLIGGLISVADWIGSSQEYFTPAAKHGFSIADYNHESKERVERALHGMGWTPTPTFGTPVEFGDLFQDKNGKPFTPNPMQQRVIDCADAATSPYLLIVEAAMGEGKTEAAIYAIDRALSTGQAHGFYLALPTQATGNAMFRRVEAYLNKREHGGDLNLQLAHGGSFLSTNFDKLREEAFDKLRLGRIYGDGSDTDAERKDEGKAGRVLAEEWFTFRKRPLLAPFGVGTIDQSLVGVLQTKHWFVRLFGLAGKVVVFDEVHAYDIYMSRLLGRLLGWLRLLGCTVILLSATLPEDKRQELIAAWDPKAPAANAADYPRVTMIGGDNGGTDAPMAQAWTVGQTNPAKTVDVAYTGLDFFDLARTLTADLPDGGCAALICNTVGRAQEAYQTLTASLKPLGWEVMLFHARTVSKWRQATERAVLANFGKEGEGVSRPPKTLLIATQVVEQSLDLDFDWMASELAPIDLLLQRMGRLWRHNERTNRVTSASHPRFYVICGDSSNKTEPPNLPPNSHFVYEAYVLLRTRIALAGGPLTLPKDIEPLIEAVYGALQNEESLSPEWANRLAESKDWMEEKQAEHARKADVVLIAPSDKLPRKVMSPGADAESEDHPVYEDEDPRVHPDVRAATRLGDPSVSVICLGTDADGNKLGPVSAVLSKVSKREARTLLNWGLSISQRVLFDALTKEDPPTPWKESPYLRYHRAVEFVMGISNVVGCTLSLSQSEGLHIEKTEA